MVICNFKYISQFKGVVDNLCKKLSKYKWITFVFICANCKAALRLEYMFCRSFEIFPIKN